ncbi:hypothetical protein BATDEDRAFT_91788 [Batrachochytrium dendrobatidis JAM81]|uniref:TRP C-terminal domain-containing protein n=1 Tax=Batrachochytrium dendrobatidis (strain JAM81 / FGSC 10211) TaxID=684364 RepID=F4PBC3_BATDJ|nr:uncharacterized protein BATDEDRAFT_91788 [Batrachochytrium dendrobatidis JAM81]EGF77419.1 hypothetical protein BATDEDRAFT_91788 [Batrachochytrium dendrobatidis JAM81]|eukprot:XP_006682070.1 hypothetical protein BATDEDRAFT_91788 [Batrachochytrium dendrobatidis JAM81]
MAKPVSPSFVGRSILIAIPSTMIWYDIPVYIGALLLSLGITAFLACIGLYFLTYRLSHRRKKLAKIVYRQCELMHAFVTILNQVYPHTASVEQSSLTSSTGISRGNKDSDENESDSAGSEEESQNNTERLDQASVYNRYNSSDDQESVQMIASSEPNILTIHTKRDFPRQRSFIPSVYNLIRVSATVVLSEDGRIILHKVKAFSMFNMGTLVFLLLSAVYIPISTSLLTVFGCTVQTCSADVASLASDLTASANTTACVKCSFNTTMCPIASSLCPGDTDLRLNADPSLSCATEILPYYGPGAILMLIVICLGVPYIYYRLTSLATKLVQIIPPNPLLANTPQSIWHLQMQLSANICRGLYYGYKYTWRYYTLVSLSQKLAVVAISVFAVLYPSNLIMAILAIHGVCLFIAIIFRPYDQVVENLLNIACLFLNAMNATVALLIVLNIYQFSSGLIYFISALNIALPTILLIYLIVIDVKRTSMLKKQIKKAKMDDPELDRLIKEIDIQMNAYTIKTLVRFFMTVGTVAFLSLALTCIGFVRSIVESNTYSSSVPTAATSNSSAMYEFAGYSSWNEFTNKCCCEYQTASPQTQTNLNEIWKCLPNKISNGQFLYKVRKRSGLGSENGLAIRPYCSSTFNSSAVCGQPSYNSTFHRYTVPICASSTNDYSDIQKGSLW